MMKNLYLLLFLMCFINSTAQNDSIKHLSYNPDAGLQYKKNGFTWTTWAFAERLFSPDQLPAWRRVRQGMEFQFPSYKFKINGNKYSSKIFYEVDFTDNNFFQDSKRFKIWENLFVTFQNANDPNKFRILFGENTSILSREDNLSSGNLPTINRSLILEQHGSTNSFGTQWGLQIQSQVNKKTFLQTSMQDNRGSLNQNYPSFQFWNALAIKITQSLILPNDKSVKKLNIGLAIDHTRNINNKSFTLLSAINNESLGNTLATGNKLTIENNLDYTNKIGSHYYTLEYEVLYSNYSNQNLNVSGGYGQLQFQVFDNNKMGDLVPFVRYDLVTLNNQIENTTEQAARLGVNYNLPFTNKLINFHIEYAHHTLKGSQTIITTSQNQFDEFRFGIRVNATRYLRF